MFSKSILRHFSSKTSKTVELTSVRYPNVKRTAYANLTDEHVQTFERIVGGGHVITDSHDTDGYNTDWLRIFRGASKCVLRPADTEQISAILRYCYKQNLAVCPQAGNTGLVGGSIPVFDEVILSIQRLNKIQDFDPVSGILTADAGCVLETLDNSVGEHGYMMPIDLGAKGSCCIGGNVATAAGGMRLMRYGSLHAHVLGLEAVLPDKSGTILDCVKPLRKDNTGLHLPHLFTGSEGQLGIITKVAMTCVPRPKSVNVAFLGLSSFENCCKLLSAAKRDLAEILSCFEFLDSESMRCLEENLHLNNVLSSPKNFYVLIETAGSDADYDSNKLMQFLEKVMQDGIVEDGTLAADVEQANYIWGLRERCAEALVVDGYTYKQDISLRVKDFYRVVDVIRERMGSLPTRVMAYGHLGDGNVHLNLTTPEYSKEVSSLLYPFLYEWVCEHGGSISAEHGLGFVKRNYAHFSNKQPALDVMRQLKLLFDPKLLLNPYKTIAMDQ